MDLLYIVRQHAVAEDGVRKVIHPKSFKVIQIRWDMKRD